MFKNMINFFKNLYAKYLGGSRVNSNGNVTPPPPVPNTEPVVTITADFDPAFIKLNLPTGNSYADWKFIVKEHVDSLPAGPAKDFGNANLFYANGEYELGLLIPAAKPLLAGSNPPAVDGKAKAFLHTNVCPDHDRNGTPFLDTIEKVTAHYAAMK